MSTIVRQPGFNRRIIPLYVSALSLVVTVGFILVGGYVMNYLVKMEEESVRKQLGAKGMKVDKKGKVVPELKIHELRAETYNGMIRLLKPGCRTIVLIVDRESKEKLVPKFYKLAWPYRRNKTLMFGFLYIEKGLPWFKKILNLTLPEPRDININPKNCIGTVLSLNGHRRYFCMYHAKHPEGSRRKVYTANNGAAAGAFMGFDSDEIEDSGSDCERDVERQPVNGTTGGRSGAGQNPLLDSPDHLPIFEDQLLDGLQMWLDRLFEGSTYRYHINYWPEFPISPANFSSRHRD
jgi:DnaJ family protein C protein 16